MLSLIVLMGMGLVQDGERKPTESELRNAHQMLAGVWQIVSVTDNGDSIGPELFRRKIAQNGKISIANRVITHVNPETGEIRTTGYIINPTRSPRTIDLITPEERILPGIYKFEGDDLVVCWSTREGKDRPAEFESTTGSFRTLMRLKVGGSAPTIVPKADVAAPKIDPATPETGSRAVPARTRTASMTSPVKTYNERKATQAELNRDRDLLGGNWEIQAITDDGESLSADLIRAKIAEDGRVRIGVRGMSVTSPRDDQKRLWAYRIDPAQSPKQIDVTTQFDTVLKGIYTFEGDRLLVCVAKQEDDPRPTAFEASSGSDRILYRLKMVKDEPAPAAAQAAGEGPGPAAAAPAVGRGAGTPPRAADSRAAGRLVVPHRQERSARHRVPSRWVLHGHPDLRQEKALRAGLEHVQRIMVLWPGHPFGPGHRHDRSEYAGLQFRRPAPVHRRRRHGDRRQHRQADDAPEDQVSPPAGIRRLCWLFWPWTRGRGVRFTLHPRPSCPAQPAPERTDR